MRYHREHVGRIPIMLELWLLVKVFGVRHLSN